METQWHAAAAACSGTAIRMPLQGPSGAYIGGYRGLSWLVIAWRRQRGEDIHSRLIGCAFTGIPATVHADRSLTLDFALGLHLVDKSRIDACTAQHAYFMGVQT